MRTNRELAEWLADRISVGVDEEVGSLDSAFINSCEVVISRAENGFDVYIDNGYVFTDTFPETASVDEIYNKLDLWNVDIVTRYFDEIDDDDYNYDYC